MNGQLSTGHWRVPNPGNPYKLFNSSYTFCNCHTLSKAFHEASLRGQ